MKHLFLPLPIDLVRRTWEEWRETNSDAGDGIHLIEVQGGCFLVTQAGPPPRVFVDLLKDFMASKVSSPASVR
ncbi:MAG TPA: hypothetical protein VFX19_14825 [Dehalococcoidia bacterium]|nr:hypothetical protein [Dehalococcoidia bacterium]